ncbi:hypothetical protein SAMN05421579_11813 [Xenorhabdus japonica]|uniref:Uncharacterized protein n=1 Tax=Xenorhabdus japonica TaxID=53341 RepID=A0A1I5BDR6_9GAMM|nr:hypothetical protein SAMN05421579_11813 [Xenorhabdus japonica]
MTEPLYNYTTGVNKRNQERGNQKTKSLTNQDVILLMH